MGVRSAAAADGQTEGAGRDVDAPTRNGAVAVVRVGKGSAERDIELDLEEAIRYVQLQKGKPRLLECQLLVSPPLLKPI